jgi:leucyl/phenylalanyl-tRNA---protein transferase
MSKLLSPELLEAAYRQGFFPMAAEDHTIRWYRPDPRAIIDLTRFHVPRRLARVVRQRRFKMTFDRDFESVIRWCAKRDETWINEEIIDAYTALHRLGKAHSIEAYRGGVLLGGIYGVSLGGAFMGESMYSRETGASSVCLVHLVERLRHQGYTLFEVQYLTPHLQQFGAIEIPIHEYLQRLQRALERHCVFFS